MKKIGFTLAEVLITIGIIGVVAAITIPILQNKIYGIRTVNQLKETQSILSQAIKMAEEEYGEVSGWDLQYDSIPDDAIKIADKLKPFMKIGIDCGIIDEKGICTPKVTYMKLNGTPHGDYSSSSKYYKIKLMNGASVWWRSGEVAEVEDYDARIVFFIDTNGINKPNIWGKDLFAFNYEKSSLRPIGATGYNYSYEDTCTPTGTGYGCAWYVLNNGNMNYLK